MDYRKISLALVGAALLAGCQLNEGERTIAGAATGAVIADVTGNNVLVGAAAGAAAGALCDDAGVCN